jgi:hypothetical protein
MVQCFIADAQLVELPFGPLVPVQAKLDAPRRVAANLDEQGAELLVVNVEVVCAEQRVAQGG